MARYEFRKTLAELRDISGRGTELVTLYIPPDKNIGEVSGYLRNEYAQSQNIKSRTTKKNVMWAIESLLNRLKGYRRPPPNGLAMFVGHMDVGKDVAVPVAIVIEPPEPVHVSAYRCDSSFWLEPLESMLVEHDVYGLLVIDRREATIGWLKGKHIDAVANEQSLVPSKHGRGGQSQRRFERLIEIAAHEFFKKIGDMANDIFLANPELKGILVGGPGYTKDFFVKEGYLHHELQKKIIQTYDTGYTDESGLRELIQAAEPTLAQLDLMKEKKYVDRLLTEIRKENGGLSAYGEGMVRRALETGAVETLLISEGYGKDRLELKCPSCDATKDITVTGGEEGDKGAAYTCPKCGTIMEVEGRKDIVKELHEVAGKYDSNVELISMDSDEGKMLMTAFGGIAAILRFRIT